VFQDDDKAGETPGIAADLSHSNFRHDRKLAAVASGRLL